MELDIDLTKRLDWLEKRIDCSYIEREYIEIQMKELVTEVVKKITIPVVSNSGLTDEELDNTVFKIAVATPYPANDIIDFMALTGIESKETEVLLKRFSKYGISNIKDVNTLAKLGYFHYC